MKKIQISITEETHTALLKEQYERKLKKEDRTSLAEVCSDLLAKCLEQKKPTQN